MKKANAIVEQPVLWILLIIIGFIIAYVLYRFITAAGNVQIFG